MRRWQWVAAAAFLLTSCLPAQATEPARDTPLVPPVTPSCISSPFGPRVLPNRPLAGTFHSGIDLPAPVGAPVRAVAAGRVIRAQRHGPGGLEMLVQHDGFVGVYSHLGHVAPPIAEGRLAVTAGQPIATVGRSGVTYGAHLYFGMLVAGKPVDPAPWLPLPRCGAAEARSAHPQTAPVLPTAGPAIPSDGQESPGGSEAPTGVPSPASKNVAGR